MIRVIEQVYPAGHKHAAHAHGEHTISIILAGSLRERVGKSEVIARPLSIVVKPAGTEHADEFGDRPVLIVRLELDSDTAHECLRTKGRLDRWDWFTSCSAIPHFLALFHANRRGAGGGQLHEVAVDAVANLAPKSGSIPRGGPPEWVRRVRSAIDDGATSVAALAASVQVHPVYLARQFRRWYGQSITEYLRSRRAQYALEALGRQSSISEAAYSAGFADHPHMCRVLKASTGLTPRAYRSLLPPAWFQASKTSQERADIF